MKQTLQKQIVLNTVLNMKNHPTADDVYKEICKQEHTVGIATVYRNLNNFAKQGMIRKVIIPNAPDRFDYRLDSHEHFLCEKCGNVSDVDVAVSIVPVNSELQYNSYTLTLYGVCDECSEIATNKLR